MTRYKARLKARILSRQEFIEFEKELEFVGRPFKGMALAEGPGGEHRPLFVQQVEWSAALNLFILTVDEDPTGQWAPLEDSETLVEQYASCGWVEARRFLFTRAARRHAS
jgi:hypothetical protein